MHTFLRSNFEKDGPELRPLSITLYMLTRFWTGPCSPFVTSENSIEWSADNPPSVHRPAGGTGQCTVTPGCQLLI